MKLKNMWKRFWTLDVHNHEGFTLVELIIVIAILAILSTGAIAGYSAYVEKANEAADKAMLAELNTAFAAACANNGVDWFGLSVSPELTVDNSANKVTGLKTGTIDVKVAADFAASIGNGFTFKVYEVSKLRYDKTTGSFVLSQFVDVYNTLKEMFGPAIADKIVGSSLGAIGTETLFDQMNDAMDMAGNLNLHTMAGDAFANAYFQYLGIDPSDENAQAAFDAKLNQLGVTDATAATNAIALYAAQNSAGLTIDSLGKWLGSDKTTQDLQNNANANTLAEAAAIYGLYLSYQKETNGTVPADPTLDVMTDALTDEAFANWVKNANGSAQAELDAYKTYMGIVNEAAKDDTTRDEILANGFQNPELESLMKDLIGN